MIKLVLTDLDGTLIPDAQEGVSPNTEAAIRELKAAGIAFGPCTGRPVNMLPDLFHNQLDLYATGVYENGTLGFIYGVEAFRHTYQERLSIGWVILWRSRASQSSRCSIRSMVPQNVMAKSAWRNWISWI